MDVNTDPQEPTASERAWAVVRIILGLLQVMAATISLYLLVEMGANGVTLLAAGVTGLLVLMSKWLFRERGAAEEENR